jgi:hypothetical protein
VQDESQTTDTDAQKNVPWHLPFDCYGNERDALDRIMNGDITLIHHCLPEIKQQCVGWKQPRSPNKKKLKGQPSVWKLMPAVLLDSEGPVLERY